MMIGEKISWQYLKGVSFELKSGGITAFMGPSGAGKTTLLKCIANLYPKYEGLITYHGKNLKSLSPLERASTVGFVLQQFHLFPHLSVLKNCTLPLNQPEKAKKLLSLLGMQAFTEAFPSNLSGGQQQRVAIARALMLSPKVLLLDEPTSALDPESKKNLEDLLTRLTEQGITVALSSHDMPFIHKIADYIHFMEEGKLIETWDRKTEDFVLKPKIQQFLSSHLVN